MSQNTAERYCGYGSHFKDPSKRDRVGREGHSTFSSTNGLCNDGNFLLDGKDEAPMEDTVEWNGAEDSEHFHICRSHPGRRKLDRSGQAMMRYIIANSGALCFYDNWQYLNRTVLPEINSPLRNDYICVK